MKMNTVHELDERLSFMPLSEAKNPPPGIIENIANHWWVCCPRRGLLFFHLNKSVSGAPQCNLDRQLVINLRDSYYPWASITYVSNAFRRVDPRDYA